MFDFITENYTLLLLSSTFLAATIVFYGFHKQRKIESFIPSVTYLPTKRSDSKILQPLKIRKLIIQNRIIRAAAYGGSSLQAMIDTHVEAAKGGTGMTTLAYCCVSKDGRTFASQLVLTSLSKKERKGLEDLVSGVHAVGGAISIQLTHGGGFANHQVIGETQKAPSSTFSPGNMSFSKEMTKDDLIRVNNDFVNSAKISKDIGFDCIEIHCGHGYLLSQFLSPSKNTRTDEYSQTDHYPLQVIQSIRQEVGADFPIAVKFNVDDGFDSGLTMNDHVLPFVRKMVQSKAVDMLVPSCGYVDQNGFHMLRGAVPYTDMVLHMPGCIKKIAMAFFGRCLVPRIPFTKQFLRQYSLRVLNVVKAERVKQKDKRETPIHVVLLGGVRSWSGMESAMLDGFSCVQTARTLIREPSFVKLIEKELEKNDVVVKDIVSTCTNCNQCVVATLAEGKVMRCVLREPVDIEDLYTDCS
jgi:2,4-dienoyl-CoA reductase-like NADH-dependent reductase (Old Yellow Enzyme family)